MKQVTFPITWDTPFLNGSVFGIQNEACFGIFFSQPTNHYHLLVWCHFISNFFFFFTKSHHFAPVQKMKAFVLPMWHATILIQETKPVRPSPTPAAVEMKITSITWMIATMLALKVIKIFLFSHQAKVLNNSKGKLYFSVSIFFLEPNGHF